MKKINKIFNWSNNNKYEGNALKSMSQEQLNFTEKRPASELDSPNSPLQSPKRLANASELNSSHDTPIRRTLRLSGSLPNLDLPNSVEKTLIANQILSLELNEQFHNNMTNKNTGDSANPAYSVPTHNSFELLNKKVHVNNSNSKPLAAQKNNIPPVTVVGATNFTSALEILKVLIPNNDFTIKYMSIGVKILLKSIEQYTKFKKLLTDGNIEFFSHDIQSEKLDRFILSGIDRISFQEIMDSLKTYQMEPLEIREFNAKSKKFENEGTYIVSFKQGSTKIQNLKKTIINYTVPKWRLYLKSTNNITQCRRCQLFGHGMRNCNLKIKCSNCGLDHTSENCNSPVIKCANCKGDHNSTSQICPKRQEFMNMRRRLATSNNKKTVKPTPAPRMNLKNFPEIPKPSPKNSNSAPDWSSIFNKKTPTTSSESTNKFHISEIGPIMSEILAGLSKCQNKEQQLILMFEMASKYIYHVEP